jgi:hypothetical protein
VMENGVGQANFLSGYQLCQRCFGKETGHGSRRY